VVQRLRRDPARLYLWWGALNTAVFTAFGLAALLYWVIDAELEPLQLVLLGTALELSVFLGEIPTGVVADTLSRKWSIVISHLGMSAGMILTGLSTAFIPLALAQMVWGLGWTFQSGADVAWITDELDDPERIDPLLTAKNRWSIWGGIAGSLVIALVVWATSLSTAIVTAGVGSALLSVTIGIFFTEHNFTRSDGGHLAESKQIFLTGFRLARSDRQLFTVLAATVLFNSGAEAVDRLFTSRLVDLGLPQDPDPVLWFTAVTVTGSLAGIVTLHWIERRVTESGALRRFYVAAAMLSAVAALLLASAPEILSGLAAVFLARGIGMRVLPVIASIWVNQRATSDVRATVQSFLGQAEAMGEVGGGIALGLVAQRLGVPIALTCSAALFVLTALLIGRSGRFASSSLSVSDRGV
jgi:MFS family permease